MKTHCHTFAVLYTSIALIPVLPALAAGDEGEDWPQWRGPVKTGISEETGWNPVGQPESLWSKSIGFGHSSFSIADGRLYTLGYDTERGLDVVYCLDPVTGNEFWNHSYPSEFWNEGHDGGTCTTPTIDGSTVYTSNREGKLFSLKAETGSVLWTRDLRAELELTPPRWGFSCSPLVVDDTLVMNVDHIVALDKATGETLWKTEKTYGNAYSTPIEYDYNGRASVLVLNGLGLAVIDRKDGSEITFFPWTRNPEQAVYGATPIVADGRIFLSASGAGGCVMLEPSDEGLEVVWENRVMRNQLTGCVLYEGHLYGFDQHILKCIDLEGNEKWRQRGLGLGAVVVVGGRLLIIDAKGEIVVAEASPEKYVELSRQKVLDGGAYWATPVLSHGLVYTRNSLGDMVCRDYRGSGDPVAARPTAPIDLPGAEDILAAHVKAVGGTDALGNLSAVHFSGTGERHAGGPIDHCDAELAWAADGAFVWRFSTGFEFGFNADGGWNLSQQGAVMLEPDVIKNLREAGDLHRMLATNWGYDSVKTDEARVFDDRLCYVVNATRPDGAERTLYFEIESGLLAGQEGDDTSMWVFSDYREVDGVRLPMSWSFFVPSNGSMTLANFSAVAVNAPEPSHYEPPMLIRMMTMSPEEKQRINEQLLAKYADLPGRYQLATGSLKGTPITISIDEGGIRLALGPQQPDFLTEPDEQDRLYSMTNRQIYITAKRNEAGHGYDIVLYAYGDEFGRLEPLEDE